MKPILEKVLDGLLLSAHLIFGWIVLGLGFWLVLSVILTWNR